MRRLLLSAQLGFFVSQGLTQLVGAHVDLNGGAAGLFLNDVHDGLGVEEFNNLLVGLVVKPCPSEQRRGSRT